MKTRNSKTASLFEKLQAPEWEPCRIGEELTTLKRPLVAMVDRSEMAAKTILRSGEGGRAATFLRACAFLNQLNLNTIRGNRMMSLTARSYRDKRSP